MSDAENHQPAYHSHALACPGIVHHVVWDGVQSKEGEPGAGQHDAGSTGDGEAVPYLGREAFLARVVAAPCCGTPSHSHCKTHLKRHLSGLLKIVCLLLGTWGPLNTLVFGETQEDNQSLVSFCCYEYHNPLVDAFPRPGLALDATAVLLTGAESAFFSCAAFCE